jgi:hypothetical protein
MLQGLSDQMEVFVYKIKRKLAWKDGAQS